ncbi:MAG: transposase family protein [Chloroflexi bacterium]|nr:transposase family protein [Chloroflexota bacterium]
MRVLGALEYAEGDSNVARYKTVSRMIFNDEDGIPRQFTWKTIQTWWYHYREHGITEPKSRVDKDTLRKVVPEELLEAIEKVLSGFHGKKYNITEVYRACIEQGHLRSSQVASSTFRRNVKKFDLLKPVDANTPKPRLAFAKAHANDMWQADTLYGPYIKIEGKPVQTFLICFIDDASRVIPHGEFYTADTTSNLINCFQTALFKRGKPRQMYVDNGSNYSSKEFSLICNRIGTFLSHTPIRDGAAKGKIERFFRTVRDQFLIRNLSGINGLLQLNSQFIDWVENSYHTREHSTLGMRPLDRFGLDLSRIKHHDPSEYNAELFYMETTRKVRADNTFSFHNIRYEAPRDLRNLKITIRYDRNYATLAPIVYQDEERLGAAIQLDYIGNDRAPKNLPPYDPPQS